jgi:hypothetical protein
MEALSLMRRSVPSPEEHFDSSERDRDLDSVVLWVALETLLKEIRQMADALDGIRAALADQETLIGQAITYIQATPAATAAAIAATEAGDTAGAAAIQADIEAHSTALAAALKAAGPQAPAGTTTPTPAIAPVAPPAATSATSDTAQPVAPVSTDAAPAAPVNPPTSTP